MSSTSSTRVAGPVNGDGSVVVFAFGFKVFTSADVLVVKTSTAGVEVPQTLTTHYSVALNTDQNNNPGGTVTMVTAPADGEKLTISSRVDATQPLVLRNQTAFYPRNIEDALDRGVIVSQQLSNKINRAVTFPISDGSGLTTQLPSASNRASKALIFDASGGVTVSTDDFENQATAAAASATAAAASATAAATQAAATITIPSSSLILASGTNKERPLADHLGDMVNILDFEGIDPNDSGDCTLAIQNAIDTGKTVYVPDGTFRIGGDGLVLDNDNQVIIFGGKGVFKGASLTDEAVLRVTGQYVRMYQPRIGLTDATQLKHPLLIGATSAPGTAGFACTIIEPYISGTGHSALFVGALETRAIGGKYRGTKYGINVTQPDFFGANLYTEQCTSHGLVADGVGSMQLFHPHSYGNAGHGFYLVGCNKSDFYGLYADTNGGNGVEVRDTTGDVSFYGGWGYKSSTGNPGVNYDWAFYNARGINLIGCRADGDDTNKVASIKVDASSIIYFDGCSATKAPVFDAGSVVKAQRSRGTLQKYNRSPDAFTLETTAIAAGATATVTVYTDVYGAISSPGTIGFEFDYQWRYTSGSSIASVGKVILQSGVGGTTPGSSGINVVYPTSGAVLTFANLVFSATTYGYSVSVDITNTGANPVAVAGLLRHLGTGRGYS